MRSRGFTLFEVLMTLGILAVVFSLLYLTFHQSMIVMAGAEEQAEVTLQGRLILERVAGELKNTFVAPRGVNVKGFQQGLVGRSTATGRDDFSDRLDFTTLSLPALSGEEGRTEVAEVGYFLEREPGSRGFTLYRRQDFGLDGDLLRGGRTLSICDGVRSLRFFYFDRLGKGQNEWNSLEGLNRNQLPVRVELQLKLEDTAGRVHLFRSQVALPIGGGTG
jgi:general secretion pathway protein J